MPWRRPASAFAFSTHRHCPRSSTSYSAIVKSAVHCPWELNRYLTVTAIAHTRLAVPGRVNLILRGALTCFQVASVVECTSSLKQEMKRSRVTRLFCSKTSASYSLSSRPFRSRSSWLTAAWTGLPASADADLAQMAHEKTTTAARTPMTGCLINQLFSSQSPKPRLQECGVPVKTAPPAHPARSD